MNHEKQPENTSLTPEQLEIADFAIEHTGLNDVANEMFVMGGREIGTVREAMILCPHFQMMEPEEVKDAVINQLREQARNS